MKDKKFETKCVHGSYKAESAQPQNLPIIQSTTYRYYNAHDVAELFDLDSPNHMYARLGSPTVDYLEQKMALLESGTAGMAASSGQAANMIALLNVCKAGDHVLSGTNIYGGTYNLFNVTLRRLGIDVEFFDQDMSLEEIVKLPDNEFLQARESFTWGRKVWGYDYSSGTRTNMFTNEELDKMLSSIGSDSAVIGHTPMSHSTEHVIAYDGRIINIDVHGAPGGKAFIEEYHGSSKENKAPLRSSLMGSRRVECLA